MIRRSVLALAAIALGACAAEGDRTVTVFAAASLTDAFEQIARDFEVERAGVEVKLNLAASQTLRTQLENGARADVYAPADPKHMEALVAQGLAAEPQTFATNQLVVTVPEDNPAGLEVFSDLPRAERIVLAGEEVPAGAYAARVLEKARKTLGPRFVEAVIGHVVSRENDVRATLQKVVLGEADAALVYVTDARSAKLPIIELPAELHVRAAYPIAAVGDSELGVAFARYVATPPAQRRLRALGFGLATDGMSASNR